MALVFNPPPNWPAPPAGWTPTPTWRPDPAWGPVPDGWQLWVEEPDPEPIDVDDAPLEPLISEESAEALGASEPAAEAHAEPVAEPAVEATEISAEVPVPAEEAPAEPVVSEQIVVEQVVAEVAPAAPTIPVAPVSADVPAEPIATEQSGAESAEAEQTEAEPKPMRYLTPVPLQETALPREVLNPAGEAPAAETPAEPVAEPISEAAAPVEEAPAEPVAEPISEAAAPVEEAPAEPVVSEQIVVEQVIAEVAPAAPMIPVAPVSADAPAEPVAETAEPVEEPAPAEASLPHSVENSPLIEFHSSPEQPAQAPEASAPAPADVAAPQAFAAQEFAPQAPADREFTGQDFSSQQNPHQGAADSFGGQPGQFQGEQFAPQHGGQPYNPYQPAGQTGQASHANQSDQAGQQGGQQAQPAAAFNPYVPQTDSASQHEQQNSQPADTETKKKGAFSGKLLGIIGAALALLIVLILVIVMLLPRGGSGSSDRSNQADGTSTSASAQSSDGSSSTTASEAKLPEGEYKEYKETVTEDKKNIDIEKVKGDASKGIVYYEFKPSDDLSSRAYITSLTEKGEISTGLSVIDMTVDRTPIRGTAWLDTTNPSSPTRKLELNGKGEWLIRVYDESSAPNYAKGEKFHTNMNYYAFTYDGGESTMEFEAKGLDSKRGFALLSASRSDVMFGTSVANMKSSMEWKSTGKNLLQVRSTSSADWSIGTH